MYSKKQAVKAVRVALIHFKATNNLRLSAWPSYSIQGYEQQLDICRTASSFLFSTTVDRQIVFVDTSYDFLLQVCALQGSSSSW